MGDETYSRITVAEGWDTIRKKMRGLHGSRLKGVLETRWKLLDMMHNRRLRAVNAFIGLKTEFKKELIPIIGNRNE